MIGRILILALPASAGAGGGGESLLNVEAGVAIATWITFLLLLGLLAKYAWKPLLAMVEEREKKLAGDLTRAESARGDAERILADYESRLGKAREETDKILADGRAKAEAVGTRLMTEAKAEAEAALEKARRSIEEERRKTVAELKTALGKTSVALATKILEREIDATGHRDLIDRFSKELEAPASGGRAH